MEIALGQLEILLATESWLTPSFLRIDPRFDPIREDPGFRGLLERYG